MGKRGKAREAGSDATTVKKSQASGPHNHLPEHSLPHAFSVVANRVSIMLQKMYAERFGLSVTGWRLLAILGSHSPLSAKALAELTAMDQVSVSRSIEQLAQLKLVSRRVDSADRRRVVLRLSKKGEETYNEILPLFHAIERALADGLPDKQVKQLRQLMDILLQHSAKVLAAERSWQELLAAYGSAAPASPLAPAAGEAPAEAPAGRATEPPDGR